MKEDLNGCLSSVFKSVDISSLQVPDVKFQVAIPEYLGQLIVTPEMVANKIKVMNDHMERMEFHKKPTNEKSRTN